MLLIDDRDRTVRLAAIEALFACQKSNLNFDRYLPELEKKLASFFSNGDIDDRQLALRLAAKLSITAIVRQAARDGDATIRLLGIKTAATMSPPVLDILQTGADDRDVQVRTEAVRALAITSETEKAKVLPVFEAMLRAGDPDTRRAGVIALGEFNGSVERTTAMIATVLHQRSVAVRTAATQALSRIAKRSPVLARPLLENALTDSAYDVRYAAIYGLGALWAIERSPSEIATILTASEADSVRRMLALEALVLKAKQKQDPSSKEARRVLESTAEDGPPLARLAAQVGCAFLAGKQEDMHAFLEKLFGG
jgi:HEAT repeat protein